MAVNPPPPVWPTDPERGVINYDDLFAEFLPNLQQTWTNTWQPEVTSQIQKAFEPLSWVPRNLQTLQSKLGSSGIWGTPNRLTALEALPRALSQQDILSLIEGFPKWQTIQEQIGRIPAGARGPIGPMGPQGSIGLQGLMGPQGPIGLTGLTGPRGDIGSQGLMGPQGPIGPQGLQGLQGLQGERGEIGPAGQFTTDLFNPLFTTAIQPFQTDVNTLRQDLDAIRRMGSLQGPQGPQGLQGLTGPIGPQGLQGLQGPAGDAFQLTQDALAPFLSGYLREGDVQFPEAYQLPSEISGLPGQLGELQHAFQLLGRGTTEELGNIPRWTEQQIADIARRNTSPFELPSEISGLPGQFNELQQAFRLLGQGVTGELGNQRPPDLSGYVTDEELRSALGGIPQFNPMSLQTDVNTLRQDLDAFRRTGAGGTPTPSGLTRADVEAMLQGFQPPGISGLDTKLQSIFGRLQGLEQGGGVPPEAVGAAGLTEAQVRDIIDQALKGATMPVTPTLDFDALAPLMQQWGMENIEPQTQALLARLTGLENQYNVLQSQWAGGPGGPDGGGLGDIPTPPTTGQRDWQNEARNINIYNSPTSQGGTPSKNTEDALNSLINAMVQISLKEHQLRFPLERQLQAQLGRFAFREPQDIVLPPIPSFNPYGGAQSLNFGAVPYAAVNPFAWTGNLSTYIPPNIPPYTG